MNATQRMVSLILSDKNYRFTFMCLSVWVNQTKLGIMQSHVMCYNLNDDIFVYCIFSPLLFNL